MNYVSAVKLWYAGSQGRKSLDTEEPFDLIVCKAGKKITDGFIFCLSPSQITEGIRGVWQLLLPPPFPICY